MLHGGAVDVIAMTFFFVCFDAVVGIIYMYDVGSVPAVPSTADTEPAINFAALENAPYSLGLLSNIFSTNLAWSDTTHPLRFNTLQCSECSEAKPYTMIYTHTQRQCSHQFRLSFYFFFFFIFIFIPVAIT